jgi:CelD/BcsL family acetyltransferase involved in cellulose biosynthesis
MAKYSESWSNNLHLPMSRVVEINDLQQLAGFRAAWDRLLDQTVGGSFFQSLDWLTIYWRHFGPGQRLRTLVVMEDDRPSGILPLTVRTEATRVGRLRLLTFPLHDWGSFYGPIGPDANKTLAAALQHIAGTARDWDFLELRWLGSPGTDPIELQRTMQSAGFQAYPTVMDYTSVVDAAETWAAYWSSRKGSWLRKFRHTERGLSKLGKVEYVRYRPRGNAHDDGSPRWDLYDACEKIAAESWQSRATDGTTLTHESVREFFRQTHEAACAAGTADLSLLNIDGVPAAFIYGYHMHGVSSGIRRGFDAAECSKGAGNVLLARTLQDSFARGDTIYDMGIGSIESKRYFQTRLIPIVRLCHFSSALRPQLLRAARWWSSRRFSPAAIAVGSVQDDAADQR